MFLIAVALGLSLMGCDSSNQYDKGYQAAWEGEQEPTSFWSNSKFKEGYEQGINDAYMYDEGYFDGINGHKPKYKKDPDYMDGFKDGIKNK